MAFSIPTARILILIALLAALSFTQATASPTSTSTSASASATATITASIYPGTTKWEYVGCQNETTLMNNTNGLRALNSGVSEALELMTVDTCLTYCAGGNYAFAGLEYTK
ncbi:hypothetical protein LCER1_G004605 [Lachnellula cervina]|uniref:WSC domain-containing protein n=1 Tax=Lachnellula cervina TaxID=1316786 RepID=A0A7D8UNM2_9HELO|nr:hypothetical protein LCER1_G004605 [Lachnellula cervina]